MLHILHQKSWVELWIHGGWCLQLTDRPIWGVNWLNGFSLLQHRLGWIDATARWGYLAETMRMCKIPSESLTVLITWDQGEGYIHQFVGTQNRTWHTANMWRLISRWFKTPFVTLFSEIHSDTPIIYHCQDDRKPTHGLHELACRLIQVERRNRFTMIAIRQHNILKLNIAAENYIGLVEIQFSRDVIHHWCGTLQVSR